MTSRFLLLAACFVSLQCPAAPRLDEIRLPEGFSISMYADNVPEARMLALGGRGTLFVGTRGDKVYAVPPGGGKARVIARDLHTPDGSPPCSPISPTRATTA